jgi:Molecular chaperone GrpE (heat shock protein)
MANSMDQRLRHLKEEREDKDAEQQATQETKIRVVHQDTAPEGTGVYIDDEENIPPEEAEAKRPKPVPKKNRKGSKAIVAELEATKELAEGNKEKYTRLLSEFDNMRERNKRENGEMFDRGAMDTLEKLLPVVDNFERALENITEEDKGPFEEGIEMIYKQMMETFEKIGVKPMNAVEKDFDPTYHNAVIHIEDENFGENKVVEEMQKGYMYKDQVLRHAMVKVAN